MHDSTKAVIRDKYETQIIDEEEIVRNYLRRRFMELTYYKKTNLVYITVRKAKYRSNISCV